ncbi:TetR/AcrR family transcriptional regulator [Nocardioides immobilis]|uniref:TetR/AcrR family transcriptional regulator n=1 Tax=Nocardioides immobilis TaxID=2049295 RepID=A0A417XT32_9ACTN|nr:TetR/AcrR family transcriptional regulator [Nocardioides immobilis]RHW23377.1 TetR/AcrR family transcriptional regulator [Nocardioides immobilis]
MSEQAASRLDRRRARTRAALIGAAQELLAEDRTNVSVLEITQAADVGLGSFYNHFDSKEELFQAAVDQVLEAHGELMDRVTEGIDDPAEVFARAFRLTGRLHRRLPGASRVMLHHGPELIMSDHGLAPRALRDIKAALEAGRFTTADPELALVAAGGAVLALGQLLHDQPDRDEAASADALTADLLRMFGLDAAEAEEICRRPLPDLDELIAPASDA